MENLPSDAEARYRSLFENMTEGFAVHEIVTDDAGRPCDYRFLEVNPAFERLTGLQGRKIIGRRVTEVLPGIEKDPIDWIGRYGKVALTGEPASFESHAAALDRWYQVSAYRPRPGCFAVTFRDVTAGKRAEQSLRQRAHESARLSEQEFHVLAEAVPQIVWATRPDGWNIYFNQQWVDYTGMTMAESHGDGWNTPFHPDDKQRAWEAWQRATQHNEPYSLECRLRRADGVYRWWLIRGVPMLGASGEILKWFGSCSDIEELKNAEAALREANDLLERRVAERTEALKGSEERLRSIGDNLPGGAVYQHVRQADGRVRYEYMSAGIEKIVGMTAEQVMADSDAFRRLIVAEDLPLCAAAEDRSAREMIPFDCEFRQRTITGDIKWVYCRSTPRRLEDGAILWDGIVTDITERKRNQEALRLSEIKYREMFSSMLEGFCIVEVVFDAQDRPIDYRFLEINPAFERQTGMHDAQGKLMRTLAPDHEAHWFEIYGKIALTGEPARFVNEAKALNRFYDVSAWKVGGPESRQVAILFNDISDAKRAEEALRRHSEELRSSNEELERFNRTMVDRELRMVELKKQVNELSVRLGEGPRYPMDFDKEA